MCLREILRGVVHNLSLMLASITHPFVGAEGVCLSGKDTLVSARKEWRESRVREVSEMNVYKHSTDTTQICVCVCWPLYMSFIMWVCSLCMHCTGI